MKKKTKEVLSDTTWVTSKEFDKRLATRLNDWLKHYESLNSEANVKVVKELQDEILALTSP